MATISFYGKPLILCLCLCLALGHGMRTGRPASDEKQAGGEPWRGPLGPNRPCSPSRARQGAARAWRARIQWQKRPAEAVRRTQEQIFAHNSSRGERGEGSCNTMTESGCPRTLGCTATADRRVIRLSGGEKKLGPSRNRPRSASFLVSHTNIPRPDQTSYSAALETLITTNPIGPVNVQKPPFPPYLPLRLIRRERASVAGRVLQ